MSETPAESRPSAEPGSPETRRLELVDGATRKFWEITLDGSDYTVRYGRLGSRGQAQTKSYVTPAAAQKAVEKLVQAKLRGGYEEVDAPAGRPARAKASPSGDEIGPPRTTPRLFEPTIFDRRFGRLSRAAVRLHPRRTATADEVDAGASKLGGSFLWPDDEDWPTCDEHGGELLPVLQLLGADFPEMAFPKGYDMMQLFWCPTPGHEEIPTEPVVYWRVAAEMQEGVRPRSGPSVDAGGLRPHACRLHPERVVEFPGPWALAEDQAEVFVKGNLLGRLPDELEDAFERPVDAYAALLAIADGIKVGGYVDWLEGPEEVECSCGRRMVHLLTLADHEFSDGNAYRWCPREDRDLEEGSDAREAVRNPAGLDLGGKIYVFVCLGCEDGPVHAIFQAQP